MSVQNYNNFSLQKIFAIKFLVAQQKARPERPDPKPLTEVQNRNALSNLVNFRSKIQFKRFFLIIQL